MVWLIFRTGTKPSRITYPCQQLAATAGSLWYVSYVVPVLAILAVRRRYLPDLKGTMIIVAMCMLAVTSVFLLLPSPVSSSEVFEALGNDIDVSLPFTDSVASETSQIFIVNGRSDPSGIQDLIDGMGTKNVLFYHSSTPGKNAGPSGIIGKDDTVLIKVNCQWDQRGGTNTDVVKGLIGAIVHHPDGFSGEIVVVDNGQGRGSFTWANANAQNHSQSIQEVVNSFSGTYNVSTFLWDSIRNSEVGEYDQGNFVSGYIVNHTANPRTGIHVSYPKFTTSYGTYISLKNGIWKNGGYDNTPLKLINVPVLKTHSGAGVTASIKHYVGVLSVPKTDGLAPTAHGWIYTGGLGTEMAESRIPDLNIVDATWVNAIPKGNTGNGPATTYQNATYLNTLLAGTDPVALDYYGAKYLLMPAASHRGYTDLSSMNPDSTVTKSFGSWLALSRNELLLAGHPATVNESQMEVISIVVSASKIGVFRPSTRKFILKNGTEKMVVGWGLGTDLPVTGDWNRDGRDEVGVYRPSIQKFILKNETERTVVLWGLSNDTPVTGDWNGDGLTDVGVYRPAIQKFILKNGTERTVVPWGLQTDIPVSGDWNGDGMGDVGVYRPSIAKFILKNGTERTVVPWGLSTDLPVSGRWR